MTRGYCVNWISGKSFEVDDTHTYEGKTWWDMRPAMILVPVSSYKRIKPWIIKACKKNKNMCDKEISTWERTVDIIDTNIVRDK